MSIQKNVDSDQFNYCVKSKSNYTAFQTEPCDSEDTEKKPKMKKINYLKCVTRTEIDFDKQNYLDYMFLSNRDMIYSKKTKDPKKIKDYNYDLEQTLKINLDMLSLLNIKEILSTSNKEDQSDTKENTDNSIQEIVDLIKKIKNENLKKIELREKIKATKNTIVNAKQSYEENNRKYLDNMELYRNKFNEQDNKLNKKTVYLQLLNKRFKEVDIYIDNLQIKTKDFKNDKQKFTEFIKSQINLKKEIKLLQCDIIKLKSQVIEIKKDNQLYREESQLYRNKNHNKELIRVVEFYRRIIRSLQTKIKILQNSFDNLTKTLNYLNLGDSKINKYFISFYI